MASFFIIGEQKVRPGVYFRYENWGLPPIAGVDDGVCAAVFQSNWGPVGQPQAIENFADIARIYGDGGPDGTTAVPIEQFRGGARRVFALRLGAEGAGTPATPGTPEIPATPGTPGTFQIMDTSTPDPEAVITLTMKENNSTVYQLYIGETTGDPNTGEIALLDGAAQLEVITFDISTPADQIANLMTAGAASAYYTLSLITDTGNALEMPVVAPVTPGTDPTPLIPAVPGTPATQSRGSYQILDGSADAVLQLTLLHPGSKQFLITIRPTLVDPNRTEMLILDGTTVMERFSFDTPAGADQVAALVSAVAAQGSNFFTLTSLAAGDGTLATVDQTEITPGTDPDITAGDYSAALEVLEAFRWNVLAVDTNDTAIHMLMQMYLNRVLQGGKFVMGVIGEPSIGENRVPFETRMLNASAYNDYQIVYVGNGFIDLGRNVFDGWLAAARISGLIAGTPSNESITHLAMTGAVELTEPLSNYDYERSILAGMLTFSTSAAKTVWVESGINSLVLLNSREDAGWKKIKRVKVRFELFQRLNDSVEPLVGRVNNDPDGRMTIIQIGNGVCNAMIAERKLLAGAHCEIDPDNTPKGDSAWFLVFADDIDALEKLYFAFKFRFAPDEAA